MRLNWEPRRRTSSLQGWIGRRREVFLSSGRSLWNVPQSSKRTCWRNLRTKQSSNQQRRVEDNFFSCCVTTPWWAITRRGLGSKALGIPACAWFGRRCLDARIQMILNIFICMSQARPRARAQTVRRKGDESMPTKIFDVIVVGTGAGGGTAMKILCEAGLSVCAINSGPRIDPTEDYRGHRQVYDLKFRGYGNPLRFEGKAHQEPYSVEESEYSEGRDLFEHDVAYSNAPGTDWYWKRCKGTGGKANFWGRSSARFGDIDFKAADLDGFGENWPVDYAEIAPWFTKAERYMGVASTVQNRPSNPDGEYLPPIPWRCIDYIIQKGAEKIGVPYLPDRCAQLTVAHNGHPACHYCGNCTRGCDVGAFFNPTWFSIPEAEGTKNLTLLTNALVRSVIVDQDGMAKGVAYVDRATRREVEVYAKVIVLAASCVETAHIMLNSKSRQWPTGIANSSGQLGRNLCDHLYGNPGYGYLPRLLGQPPTPDNIADSTIAWMPRWQNLKNPREEKFIRGYAVYMGGGCGEFPGYYGQIEGFGAAFKRDLKRYYPTTIGALIQ